MSRITPDLLRRLRNCPDLATVLHRLGVPCRLRAQRLTFACPACGSRHATRIPGKNVAHCFHCRRSFNPIDLAMAFRGCSFLEAVEILKPLIG